MRQRHQDGRARRPASQRGVVEPQQDQRLVGRRGRSVRAGDREATFDARNRLVTDGDATYAYTDRGTLSTVTEDGGAPRTLTFDAFERKVTDGGSTFTYDSFDRVGQSGGTPFTYDGGSSNLTHDGSTSYSRTPSGSLLATSDGTDRPVGDH